MFQRLLVCTDLADGVHRLTQFVPSLAASGVHAIAILHVVPVRDQGERIPKIETDTLQQAEATLQAAIPANSPIPVTVHVATGRAIDAIVKTTQEVQADVVILGTQTRTLFSEKLFGSTTMGVCQRTPIPVMILRPQLLETFTAEELDLRCRHLWRSVLVPYDGSASAEFLLEQIGQRRPERVHLCWTADTGGQRGIPKAVLSEQAHQALSTVKARLEALNLTVSTEVRSGNPVIETLSAAQVADVSAIAIASGSVGKPLEWSVPSFTSDLIRRSWRPVIYFPQRES